MSIKRRIWALPVISILILSLGLAVSVYLSTQSLASIAATESINYPLLDASKALAQNVQAVVNNIKDTVAEGDKKRLPQLEEQANAVRLQLKRIAEIPGQQSQAQRLAKEFEAYFSSALNAARTMLELEQGDLQSLIPKMQSKLQTLEGDVGKLTVQAQAQFKAGISHSNESVHRVLTTNILVALTTVLSLVIVSYFVIRTIWQQLGGEPDYARMIARAVADGDLTMHIEAEQANSVLAALKEMQGKLAAMVADIKLSAHTITIGSQEIASGNADLSARTETQASSLEQTASAMEALTQTVHQNAGNAQQANTLVRTASSVAVKGGEVVEQVVATMSEINGSSKKISDIISVIDGIAFQTNILALNAAVEAARAGEQGRGFAVVASEVRNLAQRSAAAAKEIKTLINDSVTKVAQGSRLVDQAGQTMSEIVASVQRVSDIMAAISTASEEQSTGITEVSQAVRQMDEMTQQNAALVEEAAAATESMEEQATRLSATLDVFKLSPAARRPDKAPSRQLALSA